MSSFKFNFDVTDLADASDVVEEVHNKTTAPQIEVRPFECTIPNSDHKSDALNSVTREIVCIPSPGDTNGYRLHYIPASSTEDKLKLNSEANNPLVSAWKSSSDLIPGQYEGGLKLWECAIDLVTYLSENAVNFNNLTVLDLGCGAGLPGIFSFLTGATVHFHDYNKEVINLATIPNVIINSKIHDIKQKVTSCKFFSGDWRTFVDFTSNMQECQKYDYILTSETIYNLDNYEALYSVFKQSLKKSGKIYLAAKTCYFGVGGSTQQFKTFIINKGDFMIKPCKIIEEGLKREICELTFIG